MLQLEGQKHFFKSFFSFFIILLTFFLFHIYIYYIFLNKIKKSFVTTEGFEPSPLRNSALNYRLRPLGQIVIANFISILLAYKSLLNIMK